LGRDIIFSNPCILDLQKKFVFINVHSSLCLTEQQTFSLQKKKKKKTLLFFFFLCEFQEGKVILVTNFLSPPIPLFSLLQKIVKFKTFSLFISHQLFFSTIQINKLVTKQNLFTFPYKFCLLYITLITFYYY
jgi:hypothetical protein